MKKMVFIDEDQLAIRSLREAVQGQAWFEDIGAAHSGTAGLELLQDTRPDLAFVDVHLPGINGLELLRTATKSGLPTLIIMVSSHAEFIYVKKALLYGAQGYCLKPFTPADLLEHMEKVLETLVQRDTLALLPLMGTREVPKTDNMMVDRMLRYLHSHYNEEISVKDLAELCSINNNYAGQLFRQETGETFNSYLTHIRLNKAAGLLCSTVMNVTEISTEVGYQNYFYFAKVFKKHFGVTPSSYRVGGGDSVNSTAS